MVRKILRYLPSIEFFSVAWISRMPISVWLIWHWSRVSPIHGEIWLRRFLHFHRLPAVQFGKRNGASSLQHRTAGSRRSGRSAPKVSVVMTSFNASATLELAVRSVLDQTVSNLELFIVDDRSEDNSREIIQALANTDQRIKPIFNDRNMGTYASKNQAVRQSSGDFITFHDPDDWMHNQRLESHLSAMKHGIMCSTSRLDPHG